MPTIQLFRRVVFYVFVLLYALIAPLVILSALGYMFIPKEQEVVKTGLISLATTPSGATVYLGKSRYTQKTPAVIRDLLPGEYRVKITHPGYKAWEAPVRVRGGKASSFERILLIPEAWKQQTLRAEPFTHLMPLAGTPFLLAAKSDKIGDFSVYDWKEEAVWQIVPPFYMYRGARVVNRAEVEGSPAVVFFLQTQKERKVLWIRLRKEKNRIIDISNLCTDDPVLVIWDPDDTSRLFSLDREGSVSRIDIAAQAVYPRYEDNSRGMGVFGRHAYVLKNDNSLQRIRPEKSPSGITKDELFNSALSEMKGLVRIFPAADSLIFFLDAAGRLVCSRFPYLLEENGIRGIQYARDKKRLLIWGKDKIGIADFAAFSREEDFSEIYATAAWVYEDGRNIRQCFWAHDASCVLFLDSDDVFLLEPLPDNGVHVSYVATIKKDSRVGFEEESARMFFLERGTGYLSSIDIMPRR